ncbi:MAG TPA: hypothetical protein PKK68_09060 [Methanothrix soehngenii]|nr:hypothetical protein [Methanothrix soehngenii]
MTIRSCNLVREGYGYANAQMLLVHAMLALGAAIGVFLVLVLLRAAS